MSLRLPRTGSARRRTVAVVALGLSLLLTGCGADFDAQTYQERTVADGTNADVGDIALRNVALAPPPAGDLYEAGEDVEVTLTLVNQGSDDDQLVAASSPAAGSVEILESAQVVSEIDVPGGGSTGDDVSLRLTGLTEDLRPGRYVEVVLQFANSGRVTITAPVSTTGEYDAERERNEKFHPIGEPE